MLPDQKQWDDFYQQMKASTRLNLQDYKQNQLQRRIVSMMQTKDCATLAEFWSKLSAERDGISWFLDRLAINVSELFRNPEKWDDMRNKIIPELLTRTKTIRAWSAGCSIGAEAHTLAILFEEYFPGNHSIYGSDIDQAALDQAKAGRYSQNDMRLVPSALQPKYFDIDGDHFVSKPNLKKYLKFGTLNLLGDRFDQGYDLIICRNVVIYFNEEPKSQLYRRFYESLKPGGILFVGSTERIFDANQIGFESEIQFFYRKPIAGKSQWRIAS